MSQIKSLSELGRLKPNTGRLISGAQIWLIRTFQHGEPSGNQRQSQNQSQVFSSGGATSQQTTDNGHLDIMSKDLKTSTSVDELDEKAKCAVVQQKGRFKVTSENVEMEMVVPAPTLQKSYSMQSNPLGHAIFPMLQFVLQSNISQRLEAAHDREKELLRQISDLQWRLICAQEELQ